MNKPVCIIKSLERTRNGSLFTSTIQQIRGILLARGFILLPSDTCYSIAALAIDKKVYTTINTLLNRKVEPFSLAFPNLSKVEEFVYLNAVSASLLETFTPGSLTIICNARQEVAIELTSEVLGFDNRTIGVRIPDSIIERDVASCTEYPITTVAIRDPKDNKVVTNFEQAMEIVTKGTENLENATIWGAIIEDGEFSAAHSTVVRVYDGDERLKLLREGDIPFENIKSAANDTPFWAIEEWT